MIYFLCFLASIFFSYLASHTKKRNKVILFSVLCVLILSILGGLRQVSIGTDTSGYAISNYNAASFSDSFSSMLNKGLHGEWGYLLITYTVNKILGSFNWLLFIFQLITVSCFYIGAYKLRKFVSLPLFWTMFCFITYCGTYNAIRQLMAASIIFLGYGLIEKRKYLKYSLYYIAPACLLHDSASINLPLLIGVHMITTSKTVLTKSWLKIFIMIAMILSLAAAMPVMRVMIGYLPGAARFQFYLDRYMRFEGEKRSFLTTLMFVQFLALVLYRKRAKKVIAPIGGGGLNFCQFMLLFSVMFYVLVGFLSGRVLMYFDCINLMYLAMMPNLVKSKNTKNLATVGVIFLAVLYWWRTYILGGSGEVYPYMSVL